MLRLARSKIDSDRVQFQKADILQPWSFATKEFDLITFSLVLEHVANLQPIFSKVSDSLKKGGLVYVGELHPFKQYSGSKAKFDTDNGIHEVTCFTHHISDFTESAIHNGLNLILIKEYFDHDDEEGLPRILNLVFQKR